MQEKAVLPKFVQTNIFLKDNLIVMGDFNIDITKSCRGFYKFERVDKFKFYGIFCFPSQTKKCNFSKL